MTDMTMIFNTFLWIMSEEERKKNKWVFVWVSNLILIFEQKIELSKNQNQNKNLQTPNTRALFEALFEACVWRN